MLGRYAHIRCGFCGKRADETRDVIVSGTDANICESCVRDAVSIISQKRRAMTPTTSKPPSAA